MSRIIHKTVTTIEWAREFYTKRSEWFGPTGIFPAHRARAATITRLCGTDPKRILELGAGSGGTAAATADRGHSVVAIDFSPLRARFCRELAVGWPGLEVIEGDFYAVDLGARRFDVVCYWNGFGVGTDADQRRLLVRVAAEWLNPGGCMLLDVFAPWAWAAKAGRRERLTTIWRLTGGKVRTVPLKPPILGRYDFDPSACRFIDEWWPERRPKESVRETIRCYTPADFVLLMEGTGLRADRFEVDGKPFVIAVGQTMKGVLAEAERYLVRLVPGGP